VVAFRDPTSNPCYTNCHDFFGEVQPWAGICLLSENGCQEHFYCGLTSVYEQITVAAKATLAEAKLNGKMAKSQNGKIQNCKMAKSAIEILCTNGPYNQC
jgi:hypothetical protein